MAARLAPGNVRRMHQSLHHLVADAPWSDEEVLARTLDSVLRAMLDHGPVVAWIVADTGFPKQGQHSVGVTPQDCGQLGKQANCRVAVSLSVATEGSNVPVAFRLYWPEVWASDPRRRQDAGVPEEVEFQTKLQIALAQVRRARERGMPEGVLVAEAGYGTDPHYRSKLTEMGRPPRLLWRDQRHQPVAVQELALWLPPDAWTKVTWRQGVRKKLRSRFAAMPVRPAHPDYQRAEPYPEQWLLIDWPEQETEPTQYWLSMLPADTPWSEPVRLAKHRWIIERDCEELKQELGLGHFEGRNWRGFHHHSTLCIAAYGFLVAERKRFSPSARVGHVELPTAELLPQFRPRGSPHSFRAA